MRNLRHDITFFLTLKLIALILLWGLFFSHPTDKIIKHEELAHHFLDVGFLSASSSPGAENLHSTF